jgi:alkanesulfonate monooxygenase SsuD/methylene tetrahydromethanopterin reductase-like flavin-dependent oxidoreductase (luciferase family)
VVVGGGVRVSVSVGSAYYDGENWDDVVSYVVAADRLGVDTVWSAEAWGMEAVASLGYLAAKTERIRLGSGIMQISSPASPPASSASTSSATATSPTADQPDRAVSG